MLVCYPIEATNENWLHETIVSVIQSIHARLDANQKIVENQASWNGLLPPGLEQTQRDSVFGSRGIRDRVYGYKNAVAHLTDAERQEVFSVLQNQNRIVDLLNGSLPVDQTTIRFPEVYEAALNLFVFCFEKLSDFGIRERQYQVIFDALETKICPFCGIERVMNPEETAQDQDHYLAKSVYPFSAANMRNLVPMCRCCNRDYKKAIDMIRSENGNRRRAFDPYNCQAPTITLLNSSVPNTVSPPLPAWQVEFLPACEEAETWDSVFSIRKRFKRDILDAYFSKWLEGFSNKCRKDRLRKLIQPGLDAAGVRQKLDHYREDKADSPNVGMAGFLEPLVFEFLLSQFDAGNQRVVQLITDAVLGVQMEEVA